MKWFRRSKEKALPTFTKVEEVPNVVWVDFRSKRIIYYDDWRMETLEKYGLPICWEQFFG